MSRISARVRASFVVFTLGLCASCQAPSRGGARSSEAVESQAAALSEAFTAVDVGTVGLAGKYSATGGTHTLEGAGADIFNGADGFRFVYQTLPGDGTITARVVSLENTNSSAKAGVMMRESLAADAKNVMALITPTASSGYRFQTRAVTGDATTRTFTGTASAPQWVRLTRTGNSFAAFYSSNGAAWTAIGPAVTVNMSATLLVGLAVTSHNTATLATAVFDGVAITTPTPAPPPPPPPTFSSQDIGAVGAAGSWAEAAGVHTLKGAGGDIYGAADGFRFAHQTITGDVTITARVQSLQATNVWSKAVVMIREDLSPGARNVAALVSPTAANKYRLQMRATAGGSTTSITGTTSAVPSWLRLERLGSTFRASARTETGDWVLVGSTTLALGATVRVGIGVTSHLAGTLATAVFTNVSITTPAPPPSLDAGIDADANGDAGGADGKPSGPDLQVSAPELIFSAQRGVVSVVRTLVVRNAGTQILNLGQPMVQGSAAAVFRFQGTPAAMAVPPGGQTTLALVFAPSSTTPLGANQASVRLPSNDPDQPVLDVGLWGLATKGLEGTNEPPLKQVIDTLGYAINVGGVALVLGTGAAPIGDEVPAPRFRRAGPGPVTMRPVARYSPDEPIPYGLYTNGSTGVPVQKPLGIIAQGQFQTLLPDVQPGAIFETDPGDAPFGVTTSSQTHSTFSEDGFNTGAVKHAVRSYPLKNRAGQPIPNTYLVGFEEASNGDYQDYVFVLGNVIPVAP
jgi:regulation of enolase protein 1 (concanavalin A-like superfamily)